MKQIFFIKKILLSFLLCAYSLWGLDFTVTQTGGSSTYEATPSIYIEFELNLTDSSDTENETLYCTVNDGSEASCQLSISSLNSFVIPAGTADPSVYNSIYKFRVYSKTDNLLDGDQNYKVAISTTPYKYASDLTEESQYQDDPTDGYIFNLSNIDDGDDSANFTSTPSTDKIIVDLFDSTLSEDGDTASFSIVLSQEPISDVTINLTSDDLTEGTLSTSSVTFTSSNWAQRQRVDVSGVVDATVDGDINFSIVISPAISTDAYYNTEDPDDLIFINIDNDTVVSTTLEKEIIITPVTGTTVTEGNSLGFNIKLNQDPLGTISLNPTISDGTVSPSFPNVLFDSTNWNVEQTITVSITDDEYSYGEKSTTLLISSTNISYPTLALNDNVWYESLELTIEDDDTLPINITATDSLTSENGDTGTINIELTEAPLTSDVVFTIESLDESEGVVSSSTVTFTPAEGVTNKDVTITGVDDSLLDLDRSYKIRVTWVSSDEKFNIALGIESSSNVNILLPYNREVFDFINSDDETDILTITSIDNTTSENGETASFSVVLNSEPDEFIRVNLNSTDSTEGKVISPSSKYLDFTNQNWDTPQVVTIQGVNDYIIDSLQNYEIELLPQGKRDSLYDGTVVYKKVLLSNSNVNNTAIIIIDEDISAVKNKSYDLNFTSSNTDGYPVSVRTKVDASNGSVDISDSKITYTPSLNYSGEDSFTLTFNAGYGYTKDITISVQVKDVEIITVFADTIQEEDSEGLSIKLSTYPETSADVIYSITTSNNDTVQASVVNGNLIIVPLENANGSVTINVSMTIYGVTSNIKSFIYTLTSENDAPLITLPVSSSIDENSIDNDISDNLQINDADEDNQTVTLSVTNGTASILTSGVSITTGDGIDDALIVFNGTLSNVNTVLDSLTFTPTSNFAGTASIRVQTDDGQSTTDDKTLTITIIDTLAIITVLNDVTQEEDGAGLVIPLSIGTNSSSVSKIYSVTTSNNSVAKVFIFNEDLVIIPIPNASGSVIINVTVIVDGLSYTKSFTYSLTSVNDIPNIDDISDIYLQQSSSTISDTLTLAISDDEGINSITVESSDTSFISNSDISVSKLSETQAEFRYSISPNNIGISTITITVTDSQNLSYSKSFNIKVQVVDDSLCVVDTYKVLTFDTIKGTNIYQISITDDLLLVDNLSEICDTSITWKSSDNSIISDSGVISQTINESTIIMTATIEKGTFAATKDFLITVPSSEVSDEEALDKLLFELIKSSNLRKDKIVSSLDLIEIIVGKDITWTSSDDNVVNPFSGYVSRYSTNTDINLTATIGTNTKVFELTVLKVEVLDENKVSADKELLTIGSILGENKDANSIEFDLNKPLSNEGANGSIITWKSSNEEYVTNAGDVYPNEDSDKTVILTATIENGSSSDTKEFILTVLQKTISINPWIFQDAQNNDGDLSVNTIQEGESKTTSAIFVSTIQDLVEQIVSEDSVQSIIELVDKIVTIYLNTDGSSRSISENSDGISSSIGSTANGSSTTVDDDGNVQTQIQTNSSTIKLILNSDGTVSHSITNSSNGITSINSNIPGTNSSVDEDGNVNTSIQFQQNDFVYKLVVETNNEGNTSTKYVKIDINTGDEIQTQKTVSNLTPFPSGSIISLTIMDNGEVYISTTVPLDGNLVIE